MEPDFFPVGEDEAFTSKNRTEYSALYVFVDVQWLVIKNHFSTKNIYVKVWKIPIFYRALEKLWISWDFHDEGKIIGLRKVKHLCQFVSNTLIGVRAE